MLANKNNLRSELTGSVGVLDTTISITSGEGILWETDTVACLEHVESGVVTKREIIKITAKSTDTFTVTRGFAVCIMNDATKQQGQGSQTFEAGDYLSLYLSKELWESITSGITTNTNAIATMKENVTTLKNCIDGCCNNWIAKVSCLNDSHFCNGGFGDASDGDCIVEPGNHFWCANHVYNFRNLTICEGACIRFEGQGVPQIKVYDHYINNGVIDTRAGFVKNCCCSKTMCFGRSGTTCGVGDNACIVPGTYGTGGLGITGSWGRDADGTGRVQGCPGCCASGGCGGAGGKGGDNYSYCCGCWNTGTAGCPGDGENGGTGGYGHSYNVLSGGDCLGGGGGGGGGAGRFGNGGTGGQGASGGGSPNAWTYSGANGGNGGNSGLRGCGGTGGAGGTGTTPSRGGKGGTGGCGYVGGAGGVGGTTGNNSYGCCRGGYGGDGNCGIVCGGNGGAGGWSRGCMSCGGNGGNAITNIYGLIMNVRCVSGTGCIRACGGTGGNGGNAGANGTCGFGGNGGNGANGGQVIYAYMHGTPETICVNGGAGGCGGCGNGYCNGTAGTSGTDGWKVVYTVGNDPTIQNFHLEQDADNEAINVTWGDPSFLPISPVQWGKTVVRYSTVNYPTTPTDGTLLVEETVKNTYETNPCVLNGALDGTTYYFSAFALDTDDTIIDVQTNSITTEFGWKPGVNTVAYFPLNTDLLDHGPNQYSMTNYGSVTINTEQVVGKGVAYFNGSSMLISSSSNGLPTGTNPKTLSCWVKNWGSVTNGIYCGFGYVMTSHNNQSFLIGQNSGKIHFSTWGGGYDFLSNVTPTIGQRYNLIASYNGSTYTLYINGTANISGSLSANTSSTYICIGSNSDTRSGYWLPEKAYISEVIIENVAWSSQDVLDYYNKTKSKYGY